ncbi:MULTISPECIES: molybdopterin-dependent oxidoreductase [Enterobacterales]|uniref:molybdopterin-dependent oxidoreductase n=1 Tax=Enterobacterales TaxID=91347 RepID=UPI000668123E|nr:MULTISPECIES: molybdopterin-dependent oxidoreductase [Enterobacterales]MCR9001714.1 molybdopterin-dependent oxidoreductase [Rahnella perminowiae]MDL5431041.1 molybdopterin-dependent oxidoreductase [Klebsiella michiganensis]
MTDIRRVSHCSHWGAYTILVEGGRIIGVEPSKDDPNPSPIIHSIKEWAKTDRRVLTPMVRKGWLENKNKETRGQEEFVPISWNEAIRLVAGEIQRVKSEFGNEAIFAGSYGWASSGRFHHSSTMLKRMLNLVGGYTGHVDTYSYAAGPVILRHVLGDTDALVGKGTTFDTVAEHSQTLLAFGSLSPRTAQNEAGGSARHSFETSLREITAAGVKIIHISPLRDDIPASAGADWWPVRPNTDTALLLALSCEVVKLGRHDAAFLRTHCSGSEEFLAYLSGDKDGVEKNAAWAAEITELNADWILKLADRISTTRTMIAMSWSLQRAHHGEQPYWAAIALAAICGQIGLPGGGVGFGYASLGGVGGPVTVGKNPAISAGKNPINTFIPCARITDLLLKPGETFTYEGNTHRYPDTRLVYWAGGNPFHHHQDLNRLTEAFRRPETIIVQDPYFTATALHADIILPATTSIERNDLAANTRSDKIIAMQQAIPPVGLSRSDYDIFSDIAEHLGVRGSFTEGRTEMEWLRYLYEDARAVNRNEHAFDMPEFETFWLEGSTPTPVKTHGVHLQAFRSDPSGNPLMTESKKIVLTSRLLSSLQYEDCAAHPTWIEPEEWLGSEAVGERLHMISNQPEGRLHSQLETGEASLSHKCKGREIARISPKDALRFKLSQDSTVKVWNSRGACLVTLCVDDAVRPGVLVLPTGAWLTQTEQGNIDIAGNPNVLTLDIPASMFSQGCAAHTCLVSVELTACPEKDAISEYKAKMDRLGIGTSI